MIPLVRQALVRTLTARPGSRVYDLLDEEEPRRSLPQKYGPRGFYADEREVEARLRENRDLVRGASALGGCSVYFE